MSASAMEVRHVRARGCSRCCHTLSTLSPEIGLGLGLAKPKPSPNPNQVPVALRLVLCVEQREAPQAAALPLQRGRALRVVVRVEQRRAHAVPEHGGDMGEI